MQVKLQTQISLVVYFNAINSFISEYQLSNIFKPTAT